MNELSLFPEKTMTVKELASVLGTTDSTIRNKRVETSVTRLEGNQKWYTIQDLADLCGFSIETLKYSELNLNAIMKKMSINIEVNTRLGGYHNTQKFYSENVLKALKQYQIKNSVPNALKEKETAITGNVSFTVNETIDRLMDNPETLNLMLQKSIERNQKLGIENKQLKEIISEQKTKVDSYNRISDSTGLKTIQEVSDILGYGSKTYFSLLRGEKILFLTNGVNLPKREYIDSGYFEVKEVPYERNGQSCLYSKVYVTAKGLLWLEKKTPKRA